MVLTWRGGATDRTSVGKSIGGKFGSVFSYTLGVLSVVNGSYWLLAIAVLIFRKIQLAYRTAIRKHVNRGSSWLSWTRCAEGIED